MPDLIMQPLTDELKAMTKEQLFEKLENFYLPQHFYGILKDHLSYEQMLQIYVLTSRMMTR